MTRFPAGLAPSDFHLPLKGGGRRAKRVGWGSIVSQRLTPSPTLPLSGGGSERCVLRPQLAMVGMTTGGDA
jgi:hypothetical protein